MTQKIKCPNCNFEISVDDVLSHQLEEKIRQELEENQKQKDLVFEQKEKALDERAKKIESVQNDLITTVNKQVAAKLPGLEKKIKEETEKEKSAEISSYQKMLDDKNKKISELTQDQLKLMEDKEKFEEEKRTFTLEMKKKEVEITDRVKQDLAKETDEKHQLEMAEIKKQLADAIKMNAELDQKLKQGSQQTQGEVLELELEELLRQKFIYDEIIPVPKGINGADVIQKVKNNNGKLCGTIVWESKRTKNWVDGWIPKLNDDKRREKADLAVIVSICLPEGVKNFDIKDGVYITNFQSVFGIATFLRSQIFRVAEVKVSNQDREKKSEIVYEYLVSNEFKQRIEVWLEYFKNRQSEINKERSYFTKKWEKEDKNLQKIFLNTAGIYGDLQGLIGSALPKIDILELPEGEGIASDHPIPK